MKICYLIRALGHFSQTSAIYAEIKMQTKFGSLPSLYYYYLFILISYKLQNAYFNTYKTINYFEVRSLLLAPLFKGEKAILFNNNTYNSFNSNVANNNRTLTFNNNIMPLICEYSSKSSMSRLKIIEIIAINLVTKV